MLLLLKLLYLLESIKLFLSNIEMAGTCYSNLFDQLPEAFCLGLVECSLASVHIVAVLRRLRWLAADALLF